MQTQKSHIKQLVSTTSVYGISIFLSRSAGILLLPLYTYFLSPAEMGLYNLLQSIWMFIVLFYVYGMETSFLKFFIDSKSLEEKKSIYSTTLILIFITSLIFSAILYLTGTKLIDIFKFENKLYASYLFKILYFLLIFDAIYRFPLLLLRAELKAKQYLLIISAGLIINVICNILLFIYFGLKIEAIFFSYILSVIISFILGLFLTRGYFQFSFNFNKAKHLIKYGNKFIYIGIFLLLIDISDRFFLKYLCDESVVGIYSASYKLASIMSLVIAAFKFSWTPYFLNISNEPENKTIISNIFTYFTFTGLTLFLIFSFFVPALVKMNIFGIYILEPKYQSGLIILPYILLTYFFSGIYANLNIAPFFKDKTYYLLIVSIIGIIVNFILNYILISHYTMIGAAIATLVTYVIMSVIIFIISQKIYKIQYNYKKIIFIFLLTFLIYFIKILLDLYIRIPAIYSILLYVTLIFIYLFALHITGTVDLKRVKLIFSKAS